MSERFFLTAAPVAGRAVLVGDEARHLTRVLRARVGDGIVVFDGAGSAWPARVTAIGRDRVELATGAPAATAAAPVRPVTLAVALPKGDRQKWMVEKLTELGTARLVPLATARGVAEATDAARARLERVVIEACKQCGRDRLLEIDPGLTLGQLVAEIPTGTALLIAHPDGTPLDTVAVPPTTTAIIALVGPEGGFSDEELATAEQAGARRVSLGPHILRVETAAIALAARMCVRSE
ncbi:MAG: 16S rRNA (uracil(1498)-N(3))-methyltransferase [Planctomycetia bacterium]|nr:16S rRNA (uracil(1498)-N(3))-methyltransferase [Planctomycetia bacterium]